MGALYRTAYRLTMRSSEAEDLVQDTYLQGLRSFSGLRDPSRCKAWLFRILHNLWCDRLTRERVRKAAVGIEAPRDRGLAGEVSQDGYSDEVERELAGLPPDFRTALLLVTVEEMSYAEVAEVMGCPIGTVRSRVARARAQLAAALVDGGGLAEEEKRRKESL